MHGPQQVTAVTPLKAEEETNVSGRHIPLVLVAGERPGPGHSRSPPGPWLWERQGPWAGLNEGSLSVTVTPESGGTAATPPVFIDP